MSTPDALIDRTSVPWNYRYSETHEVWIVYDSNANKVAECFDNTTAALIVEMRNQLPDLLSDLDVARREWKAWEFLAGKAAQERNDLRAKYEPPTAGTADTEAV